MNADSDAAGGGARVKDIETAFAFLTRIPVSRFVGHEPAKPPDLGRAAWAFPIVGAVVGVIGGVVLLLLAWLGSPPIVAAGLAVLATFIATGGLHEDGLADTMDGFGGGGTPEQKLAIMKDSRIGAYGATALVFSFILRIGVLTGLTGAAPLKSALALIAAEAISRAGLVQIWHALPPARPSGLSHDMGAPDTSAAWIAAAVAAFIVAVTIWPSAGPTALILGVLFCAAATIIFIRLVERAIAGRTGDTLGAGQQIAAVAFLVGVSVLG